MRMSTSPQPLRNRTRGKKTIMGRFWMLSAALGALLLLCFVMPEAAVAQGNGSSCAVRDGRQGVCRPLNRCRGTSEALPGYCPGPTRIQCCVPTARQTDVDEGQDANETPRPSAQTSSAPPSPDSDEGENDEADDEHELTPVRPPTAAAATEDLSGLPPLERAERAYRDIDFMVAADSAREALESGSLSPAEVIRAYEILGTSSAALGDDERAGDSFLRMLVLDPSKEVRELSPSLRAPYLEARGRVSALSKPFEVEVGISRPSSAVVVRISDPIGIATRVVVQSRSGGEGEFVEEEFEAAGQLRQSLPGIAETGWAETAVEVRDQYGNRIRVIGTANQPITVGEPIVRIEGRPAWKSPWLWTSLSLILLGGAGVGLYYGLRPQPYEAQLGLCFSCN